MIRIKNIYYMLSYAFRVLNEQGYKQVATEKFENAAELCAAILTKGVSIQIKRGLAKEYIKETGRLTTLRGKIDISSSIKQQTLLKRQIVCNYDNFSIDSYMNRIIKTTMELLLSLEISKMRKKEIKKLLLYFNDVTAIDIHKIDWNIRFNRNNQTYQMLISICYLIIKGLLQTTSDGNIKLMDFLDEQKMYRLYEKFVLEYYKKEFPQLNASASQISWDLDDDKGEMLPIMQSDIMLSYKEKTLIIDAKYYSHVMQVQYDIPTIHSNNLYQLFTYVKNHDKDKSGNVSGLLLYARTDEITIPKKTYKMSGNIISVDTLNLDCGFNEIKEKLNKIVDDCFDLDK